MAKFNNRGNNRGGKGGQVQRRGGRPQGGFKQRRGDGGNGRVRGNGNFGGGFRRKGHNGARKGGSGGNRGGKLRDHSALDAELLSYWDKNGIKDKRDEQKAEQKAKLDKELEEYNKSAAAASSE
jgi:hypothetical protein